MKNIPKITYYLLFIFLFLFNKGIGQVLPSSKVAEINNYKVLVAKYKKENNANQAAHYLIRMGMIFWEENFGDSAIIYFKESIALNQKTGNINALRTVNEYVGMIYYDKEKYDKALPYLKKSLEINKEKKDKSRLIQSYNNLSLVYRAKNNFNEAIENLNLALPIALEINNLKLIRLCYGGFAENYESLGNDKESIKYARLFSTFDKYVKEREVKEIKYESRLAVEKANAEKKAKQLELDLKNMRLKLTEDSLSVFEELTKKKELEIELLNKEKKLNELEVSQKEAELKSERTLRYSLIVGVIIVLLFSTLLFKEYHAKRKANILLANQNIQLKEQKEEINQANKKLTLQNEELSNQKKQIEEQQKQLTKAHRQLTDSVEYARKIQEAILPTQKAIRRNFPESFIFYRPKDIVSGDFYWFTQHGEQTIIAAVDCTGHSVPGAFMSMIGNTLLNEIVNENKIYKPSIILERLNAGVISTLKQDSDDTEGQDDGMDVTLCSINKRTKTVEIACANHQVHVFQDGENETIEGDIYSIGGMFSSKETKYTNHRIELLPNTILYMFSDGYQDQFGGKKMKKFMATNFKGLLSDCQKEENMQKQYEKIETTFDAWKGKIRQVDDVLVIGLKLS